VQRVHDLLASLGVPYEIVACEPELADTAAFCAHYGYAMEDSANTILVAGKSEPMRFVACVVLATNRLDVNGLVRRRLGVKKASFADRDQTMALTGMAIGGVTAIGLPDDVPLWIDSRVVSRPRIVLGGGDRSSKILAPPDLLLALPNAEVIESLAF
jgi:prolyl-tRNA editing enzyme YbaK/EbsC (Cys-tRNA(Pro) deacylase)